MKFGDALLLAATTLEDKAAEMTRKNTSEEFIGNFVEGRVCRD